MTEKIELVRSSGNVFRDFHYPNADVEQLNTTWKVSRETSPHW
jgi:hypothetical protein